MFDLFSWSHILILLTVALVVVGPKDLPRLMNIAGRWAGKARNMANEFKKSFDDMARQSELDELRAEVEKLRSTDPIADLGTSLNDDVQRTLNPVDNAAATPETVEAPAPRSGEYQVSEAPVPDSPVPDSHVPDSPAGESQPADQHPQAASS
jgi:sec-independent protein translocase protein TatB